MAMAIASCCSTGIAVALCEPKATRSASSLVAVRTRLRVTSPSAEVSWRISEQQGRVGAAAPSLFAVRAVATEFEGPSDEATTLVKEDDNSVEDLKQALVDSLYGTERGLRASSETRGEIVELITQLEAKNPTPAPTDAVALLDGKWILAYTSFSELFPLLAAANLPLVKVGEISQTFDASAFTVQNSVIFSGPLATTSFSTSATFEVRSPKRVQVKFEEGIIGTPQLTDSIEIPENIEVLGQKVDLLAFQSVLRPLQDAASSLARTISGQPPFKFPFQSDRNQSWLLTTFLDGDLRISRGDGGSIFVLLKDGSPLLEL